MSRDATYIIQLEGPFGTNEIESVIEKMKPFKFSLFGYDTIIGETKHGRDEEVISASKLSSPIQILRRYDDDKWEIIWNIT